jgi:ribose transport system substrate-binding protein
MSVHRGSRALRTAGAVAAGIAALVVAGCGSSGTSDGSSTTQGGQSGADVAAARAALSPYTGHPTAFPVGTPLAKRPPAGSTFAYLQCSAPTCALAAKALQRATTLLGVRFRAVSAGATASSEQAAMNSIIGLKPAAVIIPAVELSPIGPQIKQLTQAGVPVVTFGAADTAPYGVQAAINSNGPLSRDGRLLADWVVAQKGSEANAVFYAEPTYSFSPIVQRAFEAEMKERCPDCAVRVADIPLNSIGSPAPIISDIKSHPDTNVLVFVSLTAATGLGSALDIAGLHPLTVGMSPQPSNLQDIRTGALTAGIGFDIPTTLFTAVDAAARLATDQPLTPAEKSGSVPAQILGQKDITFDPSDGWSAYPDFVKRFSALWQGR